MGTEPNALNRRLPLAASLAIGVLMVSLALPNPLRLPDARPNEVAELAPVPGDDLVAAPANIGTLGPPVTPTVGGRIAPPRVPGAREVPIDKDCVGDPARQTEDLLSPPCVPYYNGENGGATWPGVSGVEVRVVFYNDFGVSGEMNEPWSGPGVVTREANLTKAIKAHVHYFNERFQTYGRLVRVVATTASGRDPTSRRSDGLSDAFKWQPFAMAYLGDNAGEYFKVMAEHRIPSFGLNFDVPRAFYDDGAPYLWSFISDQETQTEWSAAFVCRSLLGRETIWDRTRPPARFSPDPDIARAPRRIGLVWHEFAAGGIFDQMSRILRDELREQCGFRFDEAVAFSSGQDSASVIARMRAEDITTLVCYCPADTAVSPIMRAASNAGYRPEWYWDSASKMDRAAWQRAYGSTEHASFGTTYLWRMPAFSEQMHAQMYRRATKDGSTPNLRHNFNVYHVLLNLFTAIQAAGPTLNPETIQRGMYTFRFLDPDFPWLPTGSYGFDGPGPYTFIDSAMAWWWDPEGHGPGAQAGSGCMTVAGGGRRHAGPRGVRAGTAPAWPLDDAAIAAARDAGDEECTGDERLTTGAPVVFG